MSVTVAYELMDVSAHPPPSQLFHSSSNKNADSPLTEPRTLSHHSSSQNVVSIPSPPDPLEASLTSNSPLWNVIISVADTGIGISTQASSLLFQSFQQADETVRRWMLRNDMRYAM